jgi:glycosyltransferase involved in cell wall biosynthesis
LSLSYADHVLTVTGEMRENFGRRGADVGKITVILNVPDDRLFCVERYAYLAEQVARAKEEDRHTRTFKLLCHGTIEQRYGFDLIVGAVARVKNEIPGIQFRFMGQGDDLAAVLAKAEELGVASRVRYLGYLPFEAMIAEILCADVTVVPMRCNPYSALVHTNKMYEYMALRRPVIASRLRSVASYFPEDTILYFEPGDEADLARQVLYAFQNPDDLMHRIQRAAELYEVHRWQNEKERYLHVYDTLLRPACREC